ncbi:MAG: hypothetical protein Phyf2KO_05590 [Phycisphaerales bacterium]
MFGKKKRKNQDPKNGPANNKKRADFGVEPLEKRVLLSASWVDADTGDSQEGPTSNNDHFTGTSGSDIADAGNGQDLLEGLGGNDILSGGEGDDVLEGGDGDDVLAGNRGQDTLDGGAGHDTADYSTATGPVQIDITLDGVSQNTSSDGVDTLTSIEGVKGSAYDDTFSFSQAQDGASYTVEGNGGSNTINLNSVSSADAVVGSDRIIVETDTGSYSIDYTDVDNVTFSDGSVATPEPDAIDAHSPMHRWHMTSDGVHDLAGDSDGAMHGDAAGDGSGGAVFDGSDHIVIEHENDMLLDEGTVHLTFNADSVSGTQGLLSKDSTNYDDGGHLTVWVKDGEVEVRLQSTTQSYTVRSDVDLVAGQEYDVDVSFGSDGLKLFVDGELADSDSYTGGLGTSSGGSGNAEPIVLGANAWQSGDETADNLKDYFSGTISDVAIFGEQLGADDVSDIHTESVDSSGSSGELLVSETFDDGVDGWGLDASENADRMYIGQDGVAQKSFDFGVEHANQTVTIAFDVTSDGTWDSSGDLADTFDVAVNGQAVASDTFTGTGQSQQYEIEVQTDAQGRVTVELHPDTTGSDEGVFVDNFSITAGDDWSADNADELTGGDGDDVLYAGDAAVSPATLDSALETESTISHWRFDAGGVVDTVSSHDGGYSSGANGGETGVDTEGRAAHFDGGNDYVEIPHHADFETDNGTIQMWFNPDDTSGTQTLVSKDSSGYDDGGHLTMRMIGDDVEVRFQSTDASYTMRANDVVSSGEWNHVAFSFGDDGMKLFVNGDQVDSDSYTGGMGTSSGGSGNEEPWVLGANQWSSGDQVANSLKEFFGGKMDHVAFSGEALGTDDIQAIFQTGMGNADGEPEADAVSGGAGYDTVNYRDAGAGVDIDLTAGTATGETEADTLDSIEAAVGSSHDDTFSFENAEDGAVYSVDGADGQDTIDLSGYGADEVTFAEGQLTVATDTGSFVVEYDNIESIQFSDAEAIVTSSDITGESIDTQTLIVDGADVVSVDPGSASASFDYDTDTNTVSVTLSGAGSNGADLSIETVAGTSVIGTIDVDADINSITTDADVQAVNLAAGAEVPAITVNGGDGTIAELDLGGSSSYYGGTMVVNADVTSLDMGGLQSGVTINGDVGAVTSGGSISSSGSITVSGDAGAVSVTGDMKGDISATGDLTSLTASDDIEGDVTVGGDVVSIQAGDDIKSGSQISVSGSVGSITVGDVINTATIEIDGDLDSVTAPNGIHGGATIEAHAVVGQFDLTDGGHTESEDFGAGADIHYDGDTDTLTVLSRANSAPTDISFTGGTVAENAAAGTQVANASVTDADDGDTHSFELTEDAGGRFEIDANGNITVAEGADLDHESAGTHEVTVRVTDSGGETYDETFEITVGDVNEAPESLSLTGGTVAEDAQAGTVVATASANEQDAGDTLTYSLTDDADGRFEIDPDTGVITVAEGAEFDHEAADAHNITVAVSDNSGPSLVASEDFQSGVEGWTNQAGGSYETTTEIAGGDTVMQIGGTGGQQGVSKTFDTDAEKAYTVVEVDLLKLDSWDENWNNENETFVVFVDGQPAFEFQPQGNYDNGAGNDSGSGTNGNITWSVTSSGSDSEFHGGGGEHFGDRVYSVRLEIEGSRDSLELGFGTTLTQDLGDESLGINNLVIASSNDASIDPDDAVSGSSGPGHTVEQDFTISVGDVNEGPSDLSFTGGTVSENAAAGTQVASASVTDVDDGDTHSFELTDDAGGRFEIDADGNIMVAEGASLDYEDASSHEVTVRVTDSEGETYEESLTITIGDLDEAPVLDAQDITVNDGEMVTLSVNARTTDGVDFDSVDIDSYGGADQDRDLTVETDGDTLSMSGNGWKSIDYDYTVTEDTILEFQFKSGTEGEIHGIGFDTDGSIDPGKTFRLHGTQDWGIDMSSDYEGSEGEWVTYRIRVGDHFQGDFDRMTFVNDHDAGGQDGESAFRGVRVYEEGSAQISADDLEYTWEQVSGPTVVLDDPNAVTPTFESPPVDADTDVVFRVTVANGDDVSTEEVTVHVVSVNDVPEIDAGEDLFVNENTPVTLGVEVADGPASLDFDAVDIDSYGGSSQDVNLTVETDGDTLSMTGNGWKSIDYEYTVTEDTILEFQFKSGTEGEIHGIGFDTDGSIDAGKTFQLHGTQDWGIDMTSDYEGNEGEWVTYQIRVGDHFQGDFDRMFFVNDHDAGGQDGESAFRGIKVYEDGQGQIASDDLEYTWEQVSGPAVVLDDANATSPMFDSPAVDSDTELVFKVTVRDGEDFRTDEVTVHVAPVNDAPTDLSFTGGAVAENAPAGTQVASVSVTDVDANDTHTYELVGDADGRFTIDADGNITVAEGADLDHEAAGSHEVTVRVTDSGGETIEESLTITVGDVNETPTDLSFTGGAVAENAPAGTQVASVSVTDVDANDTHTYELVGDADGRFEIDAEGNITVAEGADLNHEAAGSHEVTVRVTDSGGETIEESLTITIDDVNEAPTSILLDGASVSEGVPGAVVGQLGVIDADADDGAGFAVSDSRFEVTPEGVLKLRDGVSLDHESADVIEIEIIGSDSAGNTVDGVFAIQVSDVNEAAEAISFDGGAVAEDAPAGTVVATAHAVDVDAGDSHTYELTNDAGGRFTIDAEGNIVVADGAVLDHEVDSTHTVTVRATDSGGNAIEQTIEITVDDVNEAPISVAISPAQVEENAEPGTIVANVAVVDLDEAEEITFSLTDDADGRFTIDSDGNILVADGAYIDFEFNTSHDVTVLVTDSAGHTVEQSVEIAVTNVTELEADADDEGAGEEVQAEPTQAQSVQPTAYAAAAFEGAGNYEEADDESAEPEPQVEPLDAASESVDTEQTLRWVAEEISEITEIARSVEAADIPLPDNTDSWGEASFEDAFVPESGVSELDPGKGSSDQIAEADRDSSDGFLSKFWVMLRAGLGTTNRVDDTGSTPTGADGKAGVGRSRRK